MRLWGFFVLNYPDNRILLLKKSPPLVLVLCRWCILFVVVYSCFIGCLYAGFLFLLVCMPCSFIDLSGSYKDLFFTALLPLYFIRVFFTCFIYVQGNRFILRLHAFYCLGCMIIGLCIVALLYTLVLLSVILGLLLKLHHCTIRRLVYCRV